MADEADLANDKADAERDRLVGAARGVWTGVSERYCFTCGVEIPEARREAVKGCKHCVDCQQQYEGRAR